MNPYDQQNDLEKNTKKTRKHNKDVEKFLKSLPSQTIEEKLTALCEKCCELANENRKLQFGVSNLEKKVTGLEKDKDHLQIEHNKTVLAKSRLEDLCRELQQLNKSIKSETTACVRAEEEKHKELSKRFQNTLNEVTDKMRENEETNEKLRADNLIVSEKLGSLYERFEEQEKHIKVITEKMNAEREKTEDAFRKAQDETEAARMLWVKEKGDLLSVIGEKEKRCKQLQKNVEELEAQLKIYSSKYDEFSATVKNSNKAFDSYKSEMGIILKQVVKLEKECQDWKTRWEKSDKNVLELIREKQIKEKEIGLLTRKLEQLEKLCRFLQAERSNPKENKSEDVKECENETVS